MSKYIPQLFKDAIKGTVDPTRQYEKNVTFIGTRGSSKTTALGCIALTCQIESVRNPKFTYFIDEKTSGICQVPADLCLGMFPPPTPPGQIYEADIVMTWKNGLSGRKTVRLPFAETAGEDIENLIGPHRKSMYQQVPTYRDAENLNKMIASSHGYVLVVPVSRSTMPLPQSIEDKEPDSIHRDPDLNVYRILQKIYKYKQQRGAKPIEGIAVLLTKYDMVDAWVRERGMDLYDPAGAKLFLSTYFRQTMGALKNYGLDKVRFFPVHVQVEKIQLPDGSIRFRKRDDGEGYQIMVDQVRNLPLYSESSYLKLINWIKETFTH